jgi:Glycosyl transferase family 2
MRCPRLHELPPQPSRRTGWPWTEESSPLPATMPKGSSWPRISIVTPSYNQGQFIEETIRSVLLQGYPDLEYIVMDGGSTDESVAIIHRYEPWLSHIHIGPDSGQAAALAEGFRHATGEILAWINSDDRYLPGAFARAARFFHRHPRTALGNGDVNIVDIQGSPISRIYAVRPHRFLTSNLGIHSWPQPGCFWPRWAYQQAGGVDASLRFCMDRDLFIRLLGAGHGCRIPGSPLADFRMHDTSKTSTIRQVGREESSLLLERYGSPMRVKAARLLWWGWRVWQWPGALRRRLNRRFGLEY